MKAFAALISVPFLLLAGCVPVLKDSRPIRKASDWAGNILWKD